MKRLIILLALLVLCLPAYSQVYVPNAVLVYRVSANISGIDLDDYSNINNGNPLNNRVQVYGFLVFDVQFQAQRAVNFGFPGPQAALILQSPAYAATPVYTVIWFPIDNAEFVQNTLPAGWNYDSWALSLNAGPPVGITGVLNGSTRLVPVATGVNAHVPLSLLGQSLANGGYLPLLQQACRFIGSGSFRARLDIVATINANNAGTFTPATVNAIIGIHLGGYQQVW